MVHELKVPGGCPYLTRPTLINGRLRDLSLTDFKGKPLFVFFYQDEEESHEDFQQLIGDLKLLKKAGSEVLACSTESSLVQKEWMNSSHEDGGLGGNKDIPLMSDRQGDLSKMFGIYDEDRGVCLRSILLVDDK